MDKKELIRQCAIKVIANEGYHNTSIKMIAKEAEVAVGTIYNYFKNKEEIIDYIFKVEHDKRVKFLEDMKNSDGSIKDKIKSFLDFHFDDLKENKLVGKVLIQESMIPNNRPIEGVQSFLKDLPIIFSQMFKEAKDKGEIRDINCEVISHAIFHAIRGVVYNIEISSETKDYEGTKKEVFDFILKGIGK